MKFNNIIQDGMIGSIKETETIMVRDFHKSCFCDWLYSKGGFIVAMFNFAEFPSSMIYCILIRNFCKNFFFGVEIIFAKWIFLFLCRVYDELLKKNPLEAFFKSDGHLQEFLIQIN